MIKSGNYDPSKSVSWKVLETVEPHMSDICLISSESKKLYDSKISGLTLSCEDERILKGKELIKGPREPRTSQRTSMKRP